MAATAAQQKTAAEQEEVEHGPFPIEQLQVLPRPPHPTQTLPESWSVTTPQMSSSRSSLPGVSCPREEGLVRVCLDLGSLLGSWGAGLESWGKKTRTFLTRFLPAPKCRAFLEILVLF